MCIMHVFYCILICIIAESTVMYYRCIIVYFVFVCKRYYWLLLTTHLHLLRERSRAADFVAVAAVVFHPSVPAGVGPG